jgi:homocysteine S-methyltransferase
MAMHAHLWQPFIDRSGAVILDGGLATELECHGANIDDPLWSARLLLDDPGLIREVHFDYFRAGADVGTSASYQASFEGFAARGLDARQTAALMQRSVRLLQEARDYFWNDPSNRERRCRPLVAASIGCYGAVLHDGSEYRGNYGLSVEQLMEWHRPRMAVLAASGADVLACETIPCLVEAEALVRLLADFPQTPAWFSFSCRDESRICEGATLLEAVQMVGSTENVVAVGVNCTPPQYVEALLQSVHNRTDLSLLAYPNSGERWNAAQRRWEEGVTAFDWAEGAKRWHTAGARIIGGCCRTTPVTIRTIAATLHESIH